MRYYFHVRDAQGLIPDEEGTELPSMASAQHEARLSALDLAADALRGGPKVANRIIELADESGVVLERLIVIDVLH